MKNVEVAVKDTKIVITVDASKEFGPSASGKTIIIASTEGNQPIDVKGKKVIVGLNVYTKR
ncbi:MAG: hypothetical protein ABII06_21190 [Pseudomonadota bacterium]